MISVDSWQKVHDRAIEKVTLDGLVLEFGVFSARSINYIASKRNWIVHGFDSFEGLPEFWRDGFDKGHFKNKDMPNSSKNVRLHKGWFEHSIPKFLTETSDGEGRIAYLHIDCDLYSSTKTVLDKLGHLLSRGTVIVFDEYFNYHGWQEGEFKAFQEFIVESSFEYEYITFNNRHEQVAVVLR